MFIFRDTPWLGGQHDGYELLPFKDYMGARLKSPHSLRERAALMQSVLTFGLLEGVMEVQVPESVLLRVDTSTGTQMLTSGNLPALLEAWRNRIVQLGDGEPCLQWFNRVQAAFSRARSLLMLETGKPQFGCLQRAGLQVRELADVLLQIRSVVEAVTISSRVFPQRFQVQDGYSWHFTTFVAPFYEHVTHLLVANGWCPSTSRIFEQGACMLGYALMTSKRPYMSLESSEEHGKCTTKVCVRNTVDTSNCVPKHITGTCNCKNYKPSLEAVVGFLETGKIPVVQCPPPYGGLRVSDSSNTPYIAVSHVWADGLRSTTEEGLPGCQIKRIAEMAEKLVTGGAFWIDTLSVPAIKDIRNRAIGLMAQTYRDAEAVLVIDSGIEAIPSSTPREEKLLHVLSSGWMQRLWTLQEALLAKKLIFKFSDDMVPVEELLPVREEYFNTVLVQLSIEVFRLLKLREKSTAKLSISDVSKFLRWRATSNPSDETLAISGLLKNLDAFELANLPPDQRMETFLIRIQTLPRDIIMLPGAKLNKPGFRWAPESLMRAEGTLGFRGQEALCTSSGLLAEYAALYFQDTAVTGKEWCIRDASKGRMYKLSDPSREPIAAYSCNALLMTELPNTSGFTACAAVVANRIVKAADGEDRILCEFKRRLYVQDILEDELSLEGNFKVIQTIVNVRKSGKMRVKVV